MRKQARSWAAASAAIVGCSALVTATLVATTQVSANSATTFSYTGSAQSYVVPTGVTAVTIEAAGASGTDGYGALPDSPNGGNGAQVVATLTVTAGETLEVNVGQRGSASWTPGSGTFGGGGKGWQGGGASDVRQGGTALSNRVVVAGGGGGGDTTAGGAGGAPDGGNAAANSGSGGGQGGTQSGGGAAGTGGANNTAGQLGSGGQSDVSGNGGGAGGGGYYGGGGGACASVSTCTGGGGGSSYAAPSVTSNVAMQVGFNDGNGSIVITPVAAPDAVTISATVTVAGTVEEAAASLVEPNTLCFGSLGQTLVNCESIREVPTTSSVRRADQASRAFETESIISLPAPGPTVTQSGKLQLSGPKTLIKPTKEKPPATTKPIEIEQKIESTGPMGDLEAKTKLTVTPDTASTSKVEYKSEIQSSGLIATQLDDMVSSGVLAATISTGLKQATTAAKGSKIKVSYKLPKRAKWGQKVKVSPIFTGVAKKNLKYFNGTWTMYFSGKQKCNVAVKKGKGSCTLVLKGKAARGDVRRAVVSGNYYGKARVSGVTVTANGAKKSKIVLSGVR